MGNHGPDDMHQNLKKLYLYACTYREFVSGHVQLTEDSKFTTIQTEMTEQTLQTIHSFNQRRTT